MRVNRALEKLQGLLRARGVAAVSIVGLTTLLGAKAVSAAPIGLAATVVKGLGAGTTGVAGATSQAVVRPLAKSLKLALVPVACVLMLSIGIYAEHRAGQKATGNPVQTIANVAPTPTTVPATPVAQESETSATTNDPSGIMTFHVVDAASGGPLGAAKVMFWSRNGNKADVQTDAKGIAKIEVPQPPFNIFVTAAGHAPMTTTFRGGEILPTNYIMRMPAGTFVGGVVVDEQQQQVANVKIEFRGPGIDMTKRENEEFGPDTTRYTDEIGRWWSDTIPSDFNKIAVLLTQPDFAATVTNVPVNGPDAASTVLVIQKGVTITGTVTDQGGQPITGASVRQLQNAWAPALTAKSDGSGRFELGRLNPSDLTLAVQAEGFSGVTLDATVSNTPVELSFKLAPGHILRGRVVDDAGAPITNGTIETETDNYGIRKFKWSGTTDSEGRFEWKSAPAEEVNYSIGADGFEGGGRESLRADGTEHEITLTRSKAAGSHFVRLRGTVLDADTGQPVDNFKVLIGRVTSAGGTSFPPQFQFGTEGKDGQFDFRNEMAYTGPAYQIEIQKEGYAPVASTNLLVKNGDQILMFDLHKDNGLSGEVLLPGGEPATNATVFLYGREGGVYMDTPGEYRRDRELTPVPRTQPDGHGHFSFASILDPRGFIAIDDQGYAETTIGSFGGKIQLQAWGRVEGKLSVAGRPGAGQTVCLSQVLYRSPGNERMFAPLQLFLETTTDNDGNFVFEKVPPGERRISHRLVQPFNGPGRLYDGTEKPIMVAPGTVTRVELGGSGRIVTGRATLTAATQSVEWKQVPVELSVKIDDGQGKAPKRRDYPSDDAFFLALNAYSEAQQAFWSSEKGHELERSRRNYAAYCAEDGSFSIPDVPPGQYDLIIDIRQRTRASENEYDGRKVGMLRKEISVPESEEGNDHEVLDLGTLEVRAKANVD